MAIFKKSVKSEMETGRELISRVVGQFKTWRDTISQGIESLVSHKNDNEKIIQSLTFENQELALEITAAESFREKIEQLMGEAGVPNKEGE